MPFNHGPSGKMRSPLRSSTAEVRLRRRAGIAAPAPCTSTARSMRSCAIRRRHVKAADRIVTIEGLSPRRARTRCRRPGRRSTCRSAATASADRSWRRRAARGEAETDRQDIDEAMTNICRCGTYQRIRAAIHLPRQGGHGPAARDSQEVEDDVMTKSRTRECFAPQLHDRLGRRRRRPRARLPRPVRTARRRTTARHGSPSRSTSGWSIRPDDTCVIRIARSEMGQGTLTGLAQLVAEELECDWTQGARPSTRRRGENLARKRAWGDMRTGGQPRHPHSRRTTSAAAAPPRAMMLMQAAADAVEGAGLASSTVPTASSRTRPRSARRPTARSRRPRRSSTPPDPKSDQAEGSEGLEDRRQADEAARHRRQAQRQQGLRHRRQAAGHAQRRDQGLPGLRRQARRATTKPRSPACRACRRSCASSAAPSPSSPTPGGSAKTALDALPIV